MLLESISRNKENISNFCPEFVEHILKIFITSHDGVIEEYLV